MTAPGDRSPPAPAPDEAELRRRLRGLRAEPEDAGFARALHRRLVEAGSPPPAPWDRLRAGARRLRWPTAGVAAGVAAYFLVAALRGPALPRTSEVAEAAARVPASQVALVHLNLSAEVAVASADIQVSLPEGLVFWADGGALAERSFAWQQPLAAGNNEIPIAIRGQRPGRYHLTVTARVGAERIEHDVLLEVTGT